jgi:PAS domain-containing protein
MSATMQAPVAAALQKPVELILARNLISSITLAALLIDADGTMVFFNDAAGRLAGHDFNEIGPLPAEEWASRFGPFDELGQVIPRDTLPMRVALREGLPTNGRVHTRLADAGLAEIEVSALPLVNAQGFQGAVILFWPSPGPRP